MPEAAKIERALWAHGVDAARIAQIMRAPEGLTPKSQKSKKAAHLIEVIKRMDAGLDASLRQAVMDWCACCKGGTRDKDCRGYAKRQAGRALAERIEGLSGLQYMGKPRLSPDGTIVTGIFWQEDGRYRCPCPNFNGLALAQAVPLTYCFCCAGHFRHHYQNALGLVLRTKEVRSSALNSLGREPCQFVFAILEDGAAPAVDGPPGVQTGDSR